MISRTFDNRVLLITGGTGSFGNAVLRRFLDSDLREIRIFSRDEKKQDDMRKKYNNPKLKFYIGDVRDYQSVLNAMRGADFLYHAAALKQVPSCEFHPMEAVKTNVLGTENAETATFFNEPEKIRAWGDNVTQASKVGDHDENVSYEQAAANCNTTLADALQGTGKTGAQLCAGDLENLCA